MHIGTKATPARVARAGPYAQLRLSEPVVAARGDRVILRTDTTVAGGVVLDPVPPRRLERDRLETLERGVPIEIVRTLVHAPITGRELEARGLLTPRELAHGLATMQSAGDYYFSPEWLDGLRAGVRNRLVEHAAAHPLDPGVPLAELLPAEPWAPSCSTCSTSNVATRRPTFPGPRRRSVPVPLRPTALEAELAADEVVRVEDRELARSSSRKAGYGVSGMDLPSRRRCTTAAGICSRGSARSRCQASATRWASVAARPSCCSSATTPTV